MQANTTTPHTRLALQIANQQKEIATPKRIFLKVEKITTKQGKTPQETFHVAYGYDLKTQQRIAIRLNTVQEYKQDLIEKNKMKPDEAEKKAKNAYTGSSSRESLIDKRDKRQAKFLSFDNCLLVGNVDNVPLYRAHWSELASSKENCAIFEGMAYLHVREAKLNSRNEVERKSIAHLNIIERIKTLELKNFEVNLKALRASLSTQFKNGMNRTGYATIELIDSNTGELIAEPYVFQKNATEVRFDPNTGEEYNFSTPVTPDESLHDFMNSRYEGEPNSIFIERDFLRVLMPLYFGLQINKEAFYKQDSAYLDHLTSLYQKAKAGLITVRLVSIHQVYMGTERRNALVKNINKGLIKAYSQVIYLQQAIGSLEQKQAIIRRYIPTFFVLQFHADTGNPYVAYNILSSLTPSTPPQQLIQIPDDLNGFNYRQLY